MSNATELAPIYTPVRNQFRQFSESLPLEATQDFYQAELVWGIVEGNQTPKILLLVLGDNNWHYSEPESLDALVFELLGENDMLGDESQWPAFICLADANNQRSYEFKGFSQAVPEIPGIELIRDYERLSGEQNLAWSAMVYRNLMQDLDAFHEQVYQTVKDKVSDKNDIIEEVAKILFLESFRVHHKKDSDLGFEYKGKTYQLPEIFTYQYVQAHGDDAVELIQTAFDHFKLHPDYVVVNDAGEANPIFDAKTHLRLEKPRNYETLLKAIQDLGPFTDEKNGETRQGTLADVSADFLGRVFDVFLRANFESKGGLGIYLTPKPVKDAMLDMVFHDIENDTNAVAQITSGQFRFCDPTCGSYGFGSVALSRVKNFLHTVAGLSDQEREQQFNHLLENGFVGADAAPRMVMLARVNMALQGAPKAKIFYTGNSLTTPSLKPNSFDLICTNPPFGTPKFKSDKRGKESKKAYEADMEQVLGGFRPAEEVVDSYNAYYDYTKMKWQDTGPLELNEDGSPVWAGFRTDLRNVSTGKKPKYELFPTVSGLALGSKPSKNGEWKPVKGGSIDPAVLFIDRCLQLLKPGGRLMIVLPDGILCNSGDRYVREYIMGKKDEKTGEFSGGKAIVKAVVSLPSDTFKLSGTGAKTSILYLQKRPASEKNPEQFLPEPQTDVFMAVAETLGYLVKNNIEDYAAGVSNDLDPIVAAYKRGE
ncbi:HsdM family class I SAM-dependent methyltransferase [Vibrio parahaemolyticus]|uniref:HsdM family class I SAM-dependent methyltransferase n=1 Tax=Vibrio parahaemolyticus TaxID=670 RepID=UPI001122E637|nr:N-6 DNA methylase [Vibrio parahaemolyticus]TOH87541.1 SAM-dependent methyltransferase [Vibrio parahaemolyticus]TOL02735.1 SAM-dependent methyltransferase [Vibrio parahaemolyticus]TOP86903.1 SAM-dependent methyltransferase [Vibrio parahaemolyticus]TOQ27871.1 SAM-dependent methyltransferase [Vibrio parahaemolyticus]HAV1368367.1 SAM-dependent DNA methyltransferase [Vibrio parahaemolyticus]